MKMQLKKDKPIVSAIHFKATLLLFAHAIFIACNSNINNHEGTKMADDSAAIHSQILPDTFNLPTDKRNFISSLPTVYAVKKTISQQISAEGLIDYDVRHERNIASRYNGRIEKLYVKYMFQPIRKGQLIMEIYSPEMNAEQQNLIFLLNDSNPDIQLISAAKRKLSLLGMSDSDIAKIVSSKKAFTLLPVYSDYDGHLHLRNSNSSAVSDKPMNSNEEETLLIKEGMYVTKGQTIFNLLNPHMVLAEVKIYAADISKIKLGQQVQLKFEGMAHTMNGTIDFIETAFQNNSKTLIARVYLENENHEFKVGMFLTALINADSVQGLWIPKQSMLDVGKRKIVWIKSENIFTAHEIKTGIEGPEFIQVLEGITDSDAIASNAQYIQDSESFITTK